MHPVAGSAELSRSGGGQSRRSQRTVIEAGRGSQARPICRGARLAQPRCM